MRSCSSFALLAVSFFPLAAAEVFELKQVPLPADKLPLFLHAFYVYSEAGATGVPKPTVVAQNLELQPKRAAQQVEGKVDLSLVRYEDLSDHMGSDDFCASGNVPRLNQKAEQRNRVGITTGVEHELSETGVYVLLLSNCGSSIDGSISGSVVVKGPRGFLPGNEFYKLPFWAFHAMLYAMLGMGWTAASLKYRDHLLRSQYFISAVILLGLLESCTWLKLLRDWNSDGLRDSTTFIAAHGLSTLKTSLAYAIVLFSGRGAGPGVHATTWLYIIARHLNDVLLSYRWSLLLSSSLLVACLLPSTLVSAFMFFCMLSGLSQQSEVKDLQPELAELHQSVRRVLVVATCMTLPSLLAQYADLSGAVSLAVGRWRFIWLLHEGVPVFVFFCALLAVARLGLPSPIATDMIPSSNSIAVQTIGRHGSPAMIGARVSPAINYNYEEIGLMNQTASEDEG